MDKKKPFSPMQDQAKPKAASGAGAFLKNDVPLIRTALIVFGISLLLSGALVLLSSAVLSKWQGERNQAQAQRNQTREQYKQVGNEKREIEEFQSKFVQLRKRGFIGEEKRLEWLERIRQIQESRKLLPLTYEFSAQQPFQSDPSMPVSDFELRGSKMKLRMHLLHEMDLFNFLDDLKSSTFHTVQACTLKSPDTAPTEPLAARLLAECTLYWPTLGERSAEAGKPSKASTQ